GVEPGALGRRPARPARGLAGSRRTLAAARRPVRGRSRRARGDHALRPARLGRGACAARREAALHVTAAGHAWAAAHRPGTEMILRLRLYLIAVGLTALALLATHVPPDLQHRGAHYLAWTLICLLSEMLWLSTLSGEGTVSMASTANLATLAIWGPEASMWIVSASTLIAVLFVQKKPWVRAVFNASQSVITMWLGGLVFVLLGGPPGGLENAGQVLAGEGGAAALAAPVLALFATYLLVNRALVAVAVAWSTERAYLRVLRE